MDFFTLQQCIDKISAQLFKLVYDARNIEGVENVEYKTWDYMLKTSDTINGFKNIENNYKTLIKS